MKSAWNFNFSELCYLMEVFHFKESYWPLKTVWYKKEINKISRINKRISISNFKEDKISKWNGYWLHTSTDFIFRFLVEFTQSKMKIFKMKNRIFIFFFFFCSSNGNICLSYRHAEPFFNFVHQSIDIYFQFIHFNIHIIFLLDPFVQMTQHSNEYRNSVLSFVWFVVLSYLFS